jgi:hypothetical protein
MALVKTNYGLIYNDDGSLCVTIRKDDVPFPGVTSFALEEGTTNYWNNDITDYAYRILSGGITFENTVYNGRPALKCIVTGTNPYIRVAFKHSAGNINPGDTYTASIGVAALSSEITGLVDTAAFIYFTRADFAGFKRPDHNWGKVGNRIYATCTHPTDDFTTPFYACVYFKEAGTFYLYDYQLEKKPFATSFVDGMRADGQLRIENVLRNRDSWVVSFWYKHPGDFSVARMLFGSPENDIVDPNEFSVFVTSTGTIKILNRVNNTTIFSIESSASIPANEWIFLTFIYTGSEIRAYMNRNQILSGTATINWNFTAGDPSKLWIGSVRTGNLSRTGGLFANLLIARYDPAIWTDEYIRTIYQTKRPFAVPPKLPIV